MGSLSNNLENLSEFRGIYVALNFMLAIILFFRRPDSLLNPQPWAEDSVVFLQQAIEYSFSSLFISYAGYHHTIPRLVALGSLQFGLENAPLIMNLSALVISVASTSYFFSKNFRFIIRNDFLRFSSTIFIICLPIQEVYLNITNIQWFLSIYLTLWTLNLVYNYDLIQKNKHIIIQNVFVVLAFLSSPLSIILTPALVWMINERIKDKSIFSSRSLLYLFPIAFFIIYLISCVLLNASDERGIPSLVLLFRLFSSHVVTTFFFAPSHIFVSQFGFEPTYVLSIGTIFILILTAPKKGFSLNVDICIWALIIASIILVAVSRPDYTNLFASPNNVGAGDRYIFYPITLLLILFMRRIDTFNGGVSRYIICIILIVFLINTTVNYKHQPFLDLDFKWNVQNFDPDERTFCSFPINPYGWGMMTIPCNKSQILDGQEISNQPVGEIFGNISAGQTFVCHHQNLYAIEIMLATYGRINTEDLIIHLRNSPSSMDLATIKVNNAEIPNNQYYRFNFPAITDSKDKSYYFFLESPNSEIGNAITIWSNTEDAYENGSAYKNHEQIREYLHTELFFEIVDE